MAKKQKDSVENQIASVEESILKTYGSVLMSAQNLRDRNYQYIPTTLCMDIAINGGILEGTIMNIGGLKKCGKTTTCLHIIANAQKMGKKCYYVDVEGRLQTDLLDCIEGLDQSPDKFCIIRSTQERFLTCEDYLRIMIDLFKKQPNILIVLDSIAALLPEAAFAVQVGESRKMAGVPTLLYDFLRLSPIIEANRSNLITLTHMQSNPSGYGSPFRAVGGNAIQYFSSYLLECTSSTEIPKDGDDKTGRESVFKILATATGNPGSKFTCPIRYGEGYDRYKDIATTAEEIGLITKAGAWFKFKPTPESEEVSLQGLDKVIDFLKENKDICDALEAQLRESLIDQPK